MKLRLLDWQIERLIDVGWTQVMPSTSVIFFDSEEIRNKYFKIFFSESDSSEEESANFLTEIHSQLYTEGYFTYHTYDAGLFVFRDIVTMTKCLVRMGYVRVDMHCYDPCGKKFKLEWSVRLT